MADLSLIVGGVILATHEVADSITTSEQALANQVGSASHASGRETTVDAEWHGTLVGETARSRAEALHRLVSAERYVPLSYNGYSGQILLTRFDAETELPSGIPYRVRAKIREDPSHPGITGALNAKSSTFRVHRTLSLLARALGRLAGREPEHRQSNSHDNEDDSP